MLLFTDSFDTWVVGQQKYDVVSGFVSISTAQFRNGTSSLLINNAAGSWIQKNFTPRQTYFTGFAIRIVSVQSESQICNFADTNTGQCALSVTAAGLVVIRRGAAFNGSGQGTILGTSSIAIPFGQWHYIEFFVTIASTGGIAIAIMDGNVTLLNLTGQNTQNTGNASANQFVYGSPNTASNMLVNYDDLYVCDNSGNQFNTFPLGNIVIVGQLPVANGTENDFSRGGSTINAQNWQQVNDNPPDDNTTYVFSSVVGNQDRYLYPAVPQASGICYGGMMWPRLETDDAGTRKFQGVMASQGVIQQSGTDINAIQGYADVGIPFAIDPATGLQYTLAGINAAESGIVITG